MYPYRIRLRGPWECEPLVRSPETSQAALPSACRMALPCRWKDGGLPEFAGKVRFRRHFGYPSRLEPHERLWLTFAGVAGLAEVSVNGQLLGQHEGSSEPFDFEVTNILKDRNELAVDVTGEANGGLWGEVALEVRCPAFLRRVRFQSIPTTLPTANVQVQGEVVGSSDGPLELYFLLDQKTLARIPVQATAEGEPFQASAEGLRVRITRPGETSTSRFYKVRVELVNGPVVWYTVEETIEFRGA